MRKKRERITWHTAFYDAIRLELIDYRDVLEFTIEHQLTREPLRIDMVIIKKKRNVVIDKKIASIFRGRNLVEFKGPEDSLMVAAFNKVMAYVYLYCTPPESGNIQDVTISFVTSQEPRELKKHLREVYQYTLTEKWPGITLIEGRLMPMQIINQKKLPKTEARWLTGVGPGLSISSTRGIIDATKKTPEGAPKDAFLYMLALANERQVKEVLGMQGDATIDRLFTELGAIPRLEAKIKAEEKEQFLALIDQCESLEQLKEKLIGKPKRKRAAKNR
ncbi:hypothetical protein [Treponema primitia]|uniref:hypothetical protein n=1 Tax=Treponema primitia TaxID=88058 RepID=UPI00025557A3|nr:hypothetical protein [Treponema primitia]